MCSKVASTKKASKIYNCSMTFPDLRQMYLSPFPRPYVHMFIDWIQGSSRSPRQNLQAVNESTRKRFLEQWCERSIPQAKMWIDVDRQSDTSLNLNRWSQLVLRAMSCRSQWTGFIVRIGQAKSSNWHRAAFEPWHDNHTWNSSPRRLACGSAGDLGKVKRHKVRVRSITLYPLSIACISSWIRWDDFRHSVQHGDLEETHGGTISGANTYPTQFNEKGFRLTWREFVCLGVLPNFQRGQHWGS